MNDGSARARGQRQHAADAFEAFFKMVDSPAAVCDSKFNVVTANDAFLALCGTKDLVGDPLSSKMRGVPQALDDGQAADVDVVCNTGQKVTLAFSRRGDTVAVVARRVAPALESLEAAGKALIEQARLEQQLLSVGRDVVSAQSEETLVAAVAKGVKALFPGRTFCIRIVDPHSHQLTSLYAEGRLKEGAPDTIVLKNSALEKTHLNAASLKAGKVKVAAETPLLFQNSARGIGAPLAASGQLFGAINVEYPEALSADVMTDERVLIQLANQVAVAVRNTKLIDELTFIKQYLEDLLETANALILVINKERRVIVFNQRLLTLTGHKKSAVLGQDLLSLVPEHAKMNLLRVLGSSLKGEPTAAFETALLGAGGKEVRISIATSVVKSARGDVEGVMAIGQDLTRVRELERSVIQAEKLASLGQLAASVVHEINNPMTAVVTYADALWKRAVLTPGGPQNPDTDKFRKILDNSDRVLRFTRDLVSYARPAQEKPEAIDMHATLDRAIGFCDHVLAKHGVRLERDYGTVPELLAVRQNIIQVFVNLITNACHATPQGGFVRLSTSAEEKFVLVRVQDNGSGMTDEVRGRIFEPFFTTKPDGKGTGLGLSIVQNIVERHGGQISVESSSTAGTTFLVRLPLDGN